MIIDLSLLIAFLVASAYVGAVVLRRIPLLLQVPPQLIEESFVTRPSRLKKYLEPINAFFHQRRYRDLYYALLVWTLHRIRLWLLRLERIAFRLLESLQARERSLTATEERFWGELKQWKVDGRQNGNHLPKAVLNPEPPPAVNGRELKKDRKKILPTKQDMPT